jgi:hypothetical protein
VQFNLLLPSLQRQPPPAIVLLTVSRKMLRIVHKLLLIHTKVNVNLKAGFLIDTVVNHLTTLLMIALIVNYVNNFL